MNTYGAIQNFGGYMKFFVAESIRPELLIVGFIAVFKLSNFGQLIENVHVM